MSIIELRSLAGSDCYRNPVLPSSTFGFGKLDQAVRATLNLRPMGKFIQVLDESGNIGEKSDNLKNVQLPISLQALKNASKGFITFETVNTFGNTPLRMMTLPVIENGHMARIIQVASSLEDVEDALRTLFIILVITVPSALLVASLGGQFLANQGPQACGSHYPDGTDDYFSEPKPED